MKIKVSDYVADAMINAGIKHIFMVTGGLSMHLNDSFKRNSGLTCILNHHE